MLRLFFLLLIVLPTTVGPATALPNSAEIDCAEGTAVPQTLFATGLPHRTPALQSSHQEPANA